MTQPTDTNWQPYPLKPALPRREMETRAFYLTCPGGQCQGTMRDGIKIAIDLYLPKHLPEGVKLPAVMRGTRYFRAFKMRWPFHHLLRSTDEIVRRFLANGYAYIAIDARGSGASFGYRPCPWSPDEVQDYAEVVDWIIGQPWSNGAVGATGVSYDGTSAEMIATAAHPAVKAVIPRFSLFDAYTDIVFPGGVHLRWFTENWAQGNDALDRNAVRELSAPWWQKLMLVGVKPVDDDVDGAQLAAAVASHAYNWNTHETTLRAQFRDELWMHDPEMSLDHFSPHSHVEAIQESGTAVYSYGGWLDGAYPRAAINRYLNLSNPHNRLLIGPWNHGGSHNAGPRVEKETQFDHVAEQIRFFDHHLKGLDTGIEDEEPVHYYTMGAEKWQAASAWPPPAKMTPFYFCSGNRLSREKPQEAEAADSYRVDYTAGTGETSRWNCLIGGGPVTYPDRANEDKKLLTYTTDPLEQAVEVTGHPVVTLYVTSTANDGNLFVYLEDVEPDGRVSYVTEGLLRALHRQVSDEPPPYAQVGPYRSFKREDAQPLQPGQVTELVFDLLPTSYLFKAGHAIRVALAGADKDHFAIASVPPPIVTFYRNRVYSSQLSLPIVSFRSD